MTFLPAVQFGIGTEILRLIKVCLNEKYSIVSVGKRSFPIKSGLEQGDALTPLLFKFALEYAIRKIQESKKGLKLNGIHELLVYADDVKLLGGNIHEKNTETSVLTSKQLV